MTATHTATAAAIARFITTGSISVSRYVPIGSPARVARVTIAMTRRLNSRAVLGTSSRYDIASMITTLVSTDSGL